MAHKCMTYWHHMSKPKRYNTLLILQGSSISLKQFKATLPIP